MSIKKVDDNKPLSA